MRLSTHHRDEDGARDLAATVWRLSEGSRAVSSAIVGGGIGVAHWVINAQVGGGYSRMDPERHLAELAESLGLHGPGIGMLTAASVDRTILRVDGGVSAAATVGLRVPTWAASPERLPDAELAPIRRPGTINIQVSVPVALTDGALVNAVMTATEAKTQALLEQGYAATGTASDAVCLVVPVAGEPECFGGPRSVWGARIARAVHAAVSEGAQGYTRYLALCGK